MSFVLNEPVPSDRNYLEVNLNGNKHLYHQGDSVSGPAAELVRNARDNVKKSELMDCEGVFLLHATQDPLTGDFYLDKTAREIAYAIRQGLSIWVEYNGSYVQATGYMAFQATLDGSMLYQIEGETPHLSFRSYFSNENSRDVLLDGDWVDD